MKIVATEEILKDLMLGLIYPAVLGNIIYLLIKVIFEQFNIGFEHSFTFDSLLSLKIVLLVITLVFYICDYLYITFTNDFHKLFFVFDLIFILALFETIYFIHIDNEKDSKIEPNAQLILVSYFLFMTLYLIWDLYEKSRINNLEEKRLHGRIVIWETLSMAAIVICIVLTFISNTRQFIYNWFFIPLVIITIFFAKFTYDKRKFYRNPTDCEENNEAITQ